MTTLALNTVFRFVLLAFILTALLGCGSDTVQLGAHLPDKSLMVKPCKAPSLPHGSDLVGKYADLAVCHGHLYDQVNGLQDYTRTLQRR